MGVFSTFRKNPRSKAQRGDELGVFYGSEGLSIPLIQHTSDNMNQSQQYCLRWNNHRVNFINVFRELFENGEFTDVTLVCEDGHAVKAHRLILAACSQYFQKIFLDWQRNDTTVVILKDVRISELKAILNYMYHGEVNVAQEQLSDLLKVAETLKVKGLVEERRTSKPQNEEPALDHSPSISSSNIVHNPAHSGSSNGSPPHSTSRIHKHSYRPYEISPPEHNSRPMHPWNSLSYLPPPPDVAPHSPHPNIVISTPSPQHNNAYENMNSDMSALKRKKPNNHMMQRDTPILRTVLGQGQMESSQPVSLVCRSESSDAPANEERLSMNMKNEPSEDAQSPPYADFNERMAVGDDKSKLSIPSSSPQSFPRDASTCGISGIATYVPAQNREWKRYKQYTRDDISAAIDAVRNGMSALQAARLYKVPSRTLYDKVKKLGITTSRPFKRGSNGGVVGYHYPTGSPYRNNHLSEEEETLNNNKALLEASTFLHDTIDGSIPMDDRAAFTAMAAVALHAATGCSLSPNISQRRSPSSSPTMLKYRGPNSMTPPAINKTVKMESDDHVEDLSINKKHDVMESRVIMPPMTQLAALMKKEEIEGNGN
ncbi:hypothetical protein HUJ05_000142 [Dendroctonus ponderosae]|nr:hypothetical protein HUJ05_000142 [Dendroctonus ponderosae]